MSQAASDQQLDQASWCSQPASRHHFAVSVAWKLLAMAVWKTGDLTIEPSTTLSIKCLFLDRVYFSLKDLSTSFQAGLKQFKLYEAIREEDNAMQFSRLRCCNAEEVVALPTSTASVCPQ